MNASDYLHMLYQRASELRLDKFDDTYTEAAPTLPQEALGEAVLMRAQIKLLATDVSIMDDLEAAQSFLTHPQYPCLGDKWPVETPNRFIVFPTAPGALGAFSSNLSAVEKAMKQWYGNTGISMVRQVHSAICYFTGEFQKAIELETEQADSIQDNPTGMILSQCILFRSYLATGRQENAENAMMETIRLSNLYPDCIGSYEAFRQWANLTTGWGGDNPRYYEGPDGKHLPFFEDRAEALREGISHPNMTEEPFIEYAGRHYDEPYTLRDYYVDLFHSIYWFQEGDIQQAESWFMRLYQIALNTGIYVPFVEYGRQIVPLLHHIRDSDAPCSPQWLEMVETLSGQYEDALDKYRT